jgi:iron-sulfur cluster repair protein YtfE (RIC family)
MEAPSESNGRLTAFGNQLIAIHLWLREELARLRADVDSHLAGSSERPRGLQAHCLAFCSALSRHHSAEDDGAFPVLAEQFPQLRPTISELRRDHHLVAGILRSLQGLLDGLVVGCGPAEALRVRTELDSLAALLESHFVYEEKKLVAALNSLGAQAGTTEGLLGTGADGDVLL